MSSSRLSLSLQELEQEKYHLRRRLETAQEEYDLKTAELSADIASAHSQLEEASAAARHTEREKSALIQTLTEQNQRLTTQLKEVCLSFFYIDGTPTTACCYFSSSYAYSVPRLRSP